MECAKCGEEKSKDCFRNGIKYPDDWCQRCRNRAASRKARKRKRARSWDEIELPDKKKCSNCGTVKPAQEFYKNKKSTDGLSYYCKPCKRGYQEERYNELAQRDWDEIDIPDEKECTVCGKLKDKSEFYKRKKSSDGLSAHCIPCRRYKVNSEWRDEARHRAQEGKRRAQKNRAMPDWADEKKIRQIYREADRMTQESDEVYTVDHIDPLINDKVCGLHVVANLQILTLSENSRKGNSFEVGKGNAPTRLPKCTQKKGPGSLKMILETTLGE